MSGCWAAPWWLDTNRSELLPNLVVSTTGTTYPQISHRPLSSSSLLFLPSSTLAIASTSQLPSSPHLLPSTKFFQHPPTIARSLLAPPSPRYVLQQPLTTFLLQSLLTLSALVFINPLISTTMLFSTSFAVAATALLGFAQAQNSSTASASTTVAAGRVAPTQAAYWCTSQRNTCRQVCGGSAPTDNCDAVGPNSGLPCLCRQKANINFSLDYLRVLLHLRRWFHA